MAHRLRDNIGIRHGSRRGMPVLEEAPYHPSFRVLDFTRFDLATHLLDVGTDKLDPVLLAGRRKMWDKQVTSAIIYKKIQASIEETGDKILPCPSRTEFATVYSENGK
jgi:hypothetical protein